MLTERNNTQQSNTLRLDTVKRYAKDIINYYKNAGLNLNEVQEHAYYSIANYDWENPAIICCYTLIKDKIQYHHSRIYQYMRKHNLITRRR